MASRRTYWKYRDDHWAQTRAFAALPFLVQVADCFAAGLYAAARWRRRDETRTILIERPRLRLANGRLHRANEPAVVWPDGSGRWYWQGIAVPAKLAASRDDLNAEQIARIDNQELRRVALERLGWQRFLETADAELRAQDDYGKLWSTQIRLDGERAQVVEVVNATPEPDGSYRRYFLRVPPDDTHGTGRGRLDIRLRRRRPVHRHRSIVTLMSRAAQPVGEPGQAAREWGARRSEKRLRDWCRSLRVRLTGPNAAD